MREVERLLGIVGEKRQLLLLTVVSTPSDPITTSRFISITNTLFVKLLYYTAVSVTQPGGWESNWEPSH